MAFKKLNSFQPIPENVPKPQMIPRAPKPPAYGTEHPLDPDAKRLRFRRLAGMLSVPKPLKEEL
jgi:hypothetical protein